MVIRPFGKSGAGGRRTRFKPWLALQHPDPRPVNVYKPPAGQFGGEADPHFAEPRA